MIDFEEVVCDLCNNPRYTILFRRKDLNTSLNGEYQVVKCNNCGLIYQNPRPTVNSLPFIYPSDYDQYTFNTTKGFQKHIELYGLKKRFKLISIYKEEGNLLDIGCSTGDFIEYVSSIAGWTCMGIEPSTVAYNMSNIKKFIYNGYVTDFIQKYPDARFDVVTLWNVIEHLHSPTHELTKIYNLLRENGIIVITTPNVNSFAANLFKKYWIGYELPRHLYIFSEKTLSILLQKVGFRVHKMTNIYGEHAAFMSSVRFYIRAITGLRYSLDFLFSMPIRLLLSPLFFITKFKTSGSWLTVVAQK